MIVMDRLFMGESSQRLCRRGGAHLCRSDPTLNLGEGPLYRGARQFKVSRELGKGRVGCPRSRASHPRVQAIGRQQFFLHRNGAGPCLPHPSVHRSRQIGRLCIDAAVQTPANFAPNPTRLHLRNGRGGTKPPQQINKGIAALPNQQSLTTSFAQMATEMIHAGETCEVGNFRCRNIDLQMHTARGKR
jgi:hypothetical protein